MRWRHVVHLLALVLMSICLYTNFGMDERASAMSAPSGHTHSGQSAAQKEAPRVMVDGAKNPEAIPDDLAYRLFVTALAFPTGTAPDRVRARDALFARVGLAQEDRVAFVRGLHGVADV